jgi:hypothetical protein
MKLRTIVGLTLLAACGGSPAPAPPPAPVASATSPPAPPAKAAKPVDWVASSNESTKLLLAITAAFIPEAAARLGVDGIDEKIVDLAPRHDARQREAYARALETIKARQASETNPLVKQDLAILVRAGEHAIRSSEIQEKYLVPYTNPTQLVFGSALSLLDDQIAATRRPAFVARMRKYAGMDGGTPLVELMKAEILEAMKQPEHAMPAKIELEKHLSTNPTMRDGIAKLLEKYDLKDGREPWGVLSKQLTAFDDWMKQALLPKARPSFQLPPPVYADALEGFGVDIAPPALATHAHEGFKKIQDEMKVVAAEVAKAKKLPSSDYRDVLKALKKEQLKGDEILPHYKARLADIETILKREKLVTLPSRPARIRLATLAESAEQPAPHMMPPRLLGNSGEQGEFILPLEVPGKGDTKLDDFTFAAASWTLTAHEARPGHEMQFAAMVERGVSSARAIYAFNSANVEGWGLYSEKVVFPFMPPEGKLVSLQLRLQRAARAFLDPELQQGKWTFDSAKAFLVKEVGLSPAFATSEVERYTFRSPGQATSYWYGFTKLEELRAELETKLGSKFEPMKFHDFVLAQGLLPPHLIREAALAELR